MSQEAQSERDMIFSSVPKYTKACSVDAGMDLKRNL